MYLLNKYLCWTASRHLYLIIDDNTGTGTATARDPGAPTVDNTGTGTANGCNSNQFKCIYGNSVQARDPTGVAPTISEQCIPLASVADGVNDCDDRSDEFGK